MVLPSIIDPSSTTARQSPRVCLTERSSFNNQEFFALPRCLDRADQLFVSIRLLDVAVCSSLSGFRNKLVILVRGKYHDGAIRKAIPDASGDLKTRHHGHGHIENDHIWLQGFGESYGML